MRLSNVGCQGLWDYWCCLKTSLLFDSGAMYSYISYEVGTKLNVPLKALNVGVIVEIIDGNAISISKEYPIIVRV